MIPANGRKNLATDVNFHVRIGRRRSKEFTADTKLKIGPVLQVAHRWHHAMRSS